jgi:hypothetical protein
MELLLSLVTLMLARMFCKMVRTSAGQERADVVALPVGNTRVEEAIHPWRTVIKMKEWFEITQTFGQRATTTCRPQLV